MKDMSNNNNNNNNNTNNNDENNNDNDTKVLKDIDNEDDKVDDIVH